MLLFKLTEYAGAEAQFVYRTIDELSRSRGGIVGLIGREQAPRTGTTQVTTEDGATVEFSATEIAAPIKLEWDDIVAGDAGSLLASLDEAAEQHHEQLAKYIFSTLDTLTEATGNRVDAAGKSYFQYMYEMYEKVELTFEPDGSISPSFTLIASEETVAAMERKRAEMTADEDRDLNALIDRKRQEYFARRRRRKLS
jgi:hypothetical protein